MTARWLQAKTRKMKRSHLKRWSASQVATGHGLDRDNSNPHSFKQRDQAMNGAHSLDPIPTTKLNLDRTDVPLVQVMLQRAWQAEHRGHGIIKYNHINLINGKYNKLKLYFAGLEFFFIQATYSNVSGTVTRHSIIYGSRQRALDAFNLGKITWIQKTISP